MVDDLAANRIRCAKTCRKVDYGLPLLMDRQFKEEGGVTPLPSIPMNEKTPQGSTTPVTPMKMTPFASYSKTTMENLHRDSRPMSPMEDHEVQA